MGGDLKGICFQYKYRISLLCQIILVVLLIESKGFCQDANTLYWRVYPGDGNWCTPSLWSPPPGPPDSRHNAKIESGTCLIDGNFMADANCLSLFVDGGVLRQSGALFRVHDSVFLGTHNLQISETSYTLLRGDVLVDSNFTCGFGNKKGRYVQEDGNLYIGNSLMVGWGLLYEPYWYYPYGDFTALRGNLVVQGDVWVGDPNSEYNAARLTIGGADDANRAVLWVDGSIHICQRPFWTWQSGAKIREVRSTDPGRPLTLYNDARSGHTMLNNRVCA